MSRWKVTTIRIHSSWINIIFIVAEEKHLWITKQSWLHSQGNLNGYELHGNPPVPAELFLSGPRSWTDRPGSAVIPRAVLLLRLLKMRKRSSKFCAGESSTVKCLEFPLKTLSLNVNFVLPHTPSQTLLVFIRLGQPSPVTSAAVLPENFLSVIMMWVSGAQGAKKQDKIHGPAPVSNKLKTTQTNSLRTLQRVSKWVPAKSWWETEHQVWLDTRHNWVEFPTAVPSETTCRHNTVIHKERTAWGVPRKGWVAVSMSAGRCTSNKWRYNSDVLTQSVYELTMCRHRWETKWSAASGAC